MPDYFEGDFVKGVVTQATFSEEDKEPQLTINYPVGKENFMYETGTWFLKTYRPGDRLTIIYNPSNPREASIYSFVGYWIKWHELIFTSLFFIVLFIGAKYITGANAEEQVVVEERRSKTDYKR